MPKLAAKSSTFSLIPAITARMEKIGMSQSDLAAKAEMGPSGLSQFLTGKREMRLETLRKVAGALKLELTLGLKPKK